MPEKSESWFLRTDKIAETTRVPAGVEYHRVYAGEKRRILRGVTAIVFLFAGLIILAQACLAAAAAIDSQLLPGRTGFTPLQYAAGAFSLALLIPYSMLLQRWLYGVPARSLHSVTGSFRFGVFGRALLVFGPLVLIVMSAGFFAPDDRIPWSTSDLTAFFIIGMTLTPLAAAGEEYGLRGLMFRVVGSWTRGSLSGAVLGITLTTVLFSLFHGSLDPYILGSYLVLFAAMAIITWRTGGLEVAVVLHGVYNVSALVLATTLHLDLGGDLGSRGEIAGTPANLVPSAALAIITAAIWWTTRRSGPARTPAMSGEHS
ncbi:CPBP family intramembrane glutamic endopeptidase [Porphyrobacter sp. ULC335]|uniref:CPBP family intramembrane glutamic endopeptidase n=1 Tax=Porphyrobacter sp. ULC335 TaxID=2854260 RepID=UPI002220CE87|nr:type II CAAX endopeptidase family protein [Porphyrobacter sp. ULC335]UYV16696.1 CPBP family intramembrane metalloprotease [Porphyrobacter sp. ULC335]